MADYMLSGVFGGCDMRNIPELQYGFGSASKEDVGDQVVELDKHIRELTSRKLTNEGDSLNAFLGISAQYAK